MRSTTIFVLIGLLFVGTGGCSSNNNPVIPENGRTAQAFGNAIDIFGGGANSGVFQPHYHDVALTQVREFDTEASTFPNHGTFAVTLNRAGDNNPADQFKPVFRWLDAINPTTDSADPPRLVTLRDFVDTNHNDPSDYRAVSCDAIYDDDGDHLDTNPFTSAILEVVVCYQVRDIDNLPTNADDWDIGRTELRWVTSTELGNEFDDIDQFWTKEPTSRTDFYYDEWTNGALTDEQHDEYNPDIAYDFDNGDIYLVYTNVENDPNYQVLKYRYFRRNTLFPPAFSENYAQALDGHNGFDPSIDVGRITIVDLAQFNRPTIAIAYTSTYHDPGGGVHKGFHVNLTYWHRDQLRIDRFDTYALMNPDFRYMDAGLPSIDIAPEANAANGGFLTYTQVVGSDGFGAITHVYVAGFLGQVADLGTHFRVSNPNDVDPVDPNGQAYDDGMYSSIAFNEEGEDITASLTFLYQQDVDNIWIPCVRGLTFTAAVPDPPTPSVWTIDFTQWIPNSVDIIGNFNVSEIPFINPGISSAIFVGANNRYWAAWCDRTEMEPPPQFVQAAWGNAQ